MIAVKVNLVNSLKNVEMCLAHSNCLIKISYCYFIRKVFHNLYKSINGRCCCQFSLTINNVELNKSVCHLDTYTIARVNSQKWSSCIIENIPCACCIFTASQPKPILLHLALWPQGGNLYIVFPGWLAKWLLCNFF